MPEVHISSLLVHRRPEHAPSVDAIIGQIDGAEIHAVSPEGKVLVTLETSGTGAVSEALATINGTEGVLSAVLVYHQFESTTGQE